MKIFDTFLFFNELDILEIRLNILYPHIDYFVINESVETFSGDSKPLYYFENRKRFKKFEDKIIHNIIDISSKEKLFFAGQKYGTNIECQQRDTYQKDSIKKCLDSALGQDYPDFEVIFLDACSVDGTFEKAKEYEKTHSNIRVLRNETRKKNTKKKHFYIKRASGNNVLHDETKNLYTQTKTANI